ncbi:filamentous hemagglutinin N-terminal domain-containing protein [Phormidium pseudopriestleyi FRX01]|uniref:Filamentous hemagglutinin N-terminal domain-containing protein n=1 Tax=Phormidium pseudopriestleyi FRX01 TaxID=1759528 RepID=A0ABS3FU23_9CYAN|nr:filamentous hemagglutinin N-terminal domain-containing protein [Phormidium pseudopriestleyi]MBO0350563.1 filamentous hemagglutinin N-terminal domain-containing protein [Phormidium pseudopriestleyi FRX01]
MLSAIRLVKPTQHWQIKWLLLPFSLGLFSSPSSAQIVPDTTLPVNSIVTPNGSRQVITGGTPAGSNLFHSFTEFSVPTGGTAYFNQGNSLQNIFTRITGINPSNIDGILQANGSANLFLLNPNGIIFGTNAQLNIGGSFFASAGDRIQFSDRTEFPANPGDNPPLLTVSSPIGLQLGTDPGNITLNGTRLEVHPGQNLAVVGGNLAIAGAQLTAPSGTIDLTAQNIALSAGALLDVSGEAGGKIQIRSGELTLTNQSRIVADTLGNGTGRGIEITTDRLQLSDRAFISASTFGSGSGGNLTIQATESVTLTGNDNYETSLNQIFNQEITKPSDIGTGLFALTFSQGRGGNLTVTTPIVNLSNNAYFSTATFGSGPGGNFTVNARNIHLIESQFLADNFGDGDASQVRVNAETLRLENGGAIGTSTLGEGVGGTIDLNISDSFEATGTTATGRFNSGIFAKAYANATHPAGNINIQTGRLTLGGGAHITATTFAVVDGGIVNINASAIELRGISPDGAYITSIETQSQNAGGAGDLTIQTDSLIVADGAMISTSALKTGDGGNLTLQASDFVELTGSGTFNLTERILEQAFEPSQLQDGLFTASAGSGNAGNLTLRTGRLSLTNQAHIATSTLNQGSGGTLTIQARDRISLQEAYLVTGTAGTGQAGDILIETSELILLDRSEIIASTIATGSGGNIQVNASESVQLQNQSSIISTSEGPGNAGYVLIQTGQFRAENQSFISTFTDQEGNAGFLGIVAGESVELLNNSALETTTGGIGDAGFLQIQTRSLTLDNSSITVSAQGTGEAGNLNIATDRMSLNNSVLLGIAASGRGGNVQLEVNELLTLRQGSAISAEALGTGDGGNVAVITDAIALLENSRISANAVQGMGGNIQIFSQALFESPESQITASSNQGIDGVVSVNTPDLQPTQGLIALPSEIVNITNLVFEKCGIGTSQNEFIVTGRGGLPPNPTDPFNGDRVLEDLGTLQSYPDLPRQQSTGAKIPPTPPLVEANTWAIAPDGQLILTTAPTPHHPGDRWDTPAHCHPRS